MKPIKLLTSLIIIICLTLSAAWLTYRDKTTPQYMSVEEFAGDDLQTAIQKIADVTVTGGAPGIQLLVRKNGIDHIATAGTANKSNNKPMPKTDPLRIASVSKVYTASVILSLADKGKINLDKNISEYLPSDITQGLPNADRATVRQLLMHTSGIPDYYDIQSYLLQDWTTPITLERTLPVAKRGSAETKPGEKFTYSNMGYILLGEIAEKVSSKPLNTLIHENIVSPMSFSATHYNQKHPTEDGIHGYGTLLRPWADTYDLWEHSGPDGGVVASASEVAQLLEALTFENGSLKKWGDQMLKNTVRSGKRKHQGIGLEIITTRDEVTLIGHTGDVFGYQTVAFAVPEKNVVFVGHINCDCSQLSLSIIINTYRALEALRNW